MLYKGIYTVWHNFVYTAMVAVTIVYYLRDCGDVVQRFIELHSAGC